MALLINSILFSQEVKKEKKEPVAKFYGYITYRAFFDTYESVEAREGNIYLYPKAENIDANGDDLNKYIQHEALTLDTRLGVKLNGPDAFGAKVSGLVETDWMGTSESYTRMPRLRHAFIKLTWSKVNLLAGHTWHPMFTPECFPKVLNFGAALIFNSFNRTPQIRLTFIPVEQFYMLIAASSYGYNNFAGIDAKAQRNSGVPDIHGQITFKNDFITTGLVAGIKTLKPRTSYTIVDNNNVEQVYKTKETLTTFDLKGFLKLNISKVTLSWAGIYGKNMSPYVMIGGFGVADDPAITDDYSYIGLSTIAAWFDGEVNLNPVKFGLFAGYTANLGAGDTYYSFTNPTARAENMANILRISPRFTYTSGKVTLGLEYMLNTATYATQWDANHKVEETADLVMNHRTMFVVKYSF